MYNPIGWLRMIASDQENSCLLSIAYPYAPLLVPSGREVNFRARFHYLVDVFLQMVMSVSLETKYSIQDKYKVSTK